MSLLRRSRGQHTIIAANERLQQRVQDLEATVAALEQQTGRAVGRLHGEISRVNWLGARLDRRVRDLDSWRDNIDAVTVPQVGARDTSRPEDQNTAPHGTRTANGPTPLWEAPLAAQPPTRGPATWGTDAEQLPRVQGVAS